MKIKTNLVRVGGLLSVLALSSAAHADAPDLAAKCREAGENGACAAAGAPLEGSSPETTVELYSASCAARGASFFLRRRCAYEMSA